MRPRGTAQQHRLTIHSIPGYSQASNLRRFEVPAAVSACATASAAWYAAARMTAGGCRTARRTAPGSSGVGKRAYSSGCGCGSAALL